VAAYADRFTIRSTLLCNHFLARFGSTPFSFSMSAIWRSDVLCEWSCLIHATARCSVAFSTNLPPRPKSHP
jgi:hypothetical protein